MGTRKENAIKLLCESVQSTIRSGVVITGVTRCVEELVLNSIDAKATRILIDIDLVDFNLRVEDDGYGISKNDMEIIGTRYATNKCHSISDLATLKYYGYRGEALANIIDLSSSVEIYCQPQSDNPFDSSDVFVKKFMCGRSHGSVRRDSSRKRSSPGVTVVISGFLSRVPVRQKQINFLEIEKTKTMLERIHIMNPRIQIDFRNQLVGILHIIPVNSSTESFQNLYNKSLTEVSVSYGLFCFQAWFSTESSSSKSLQLVYVNKRYTSRNTIHRTLNEILIEILGTAKGQDSEKQLGKREKIFPIFVFNIITALTEYDMTLDPRKSVVEFKNWELVLEGIAAMKVLFKAALHSCKGNELSASGTKNKSNNVGSTVDIDSEAIPAYGSSVTSRVFKTAIHGNVVRRVKSDQRSPSPISKSGINCISEDGEAISGIRVAVENHKSTQLETPLDNLYVQSKLSKFKNRDKPKIQSQSTGVMVGSTVTVPHQSEVESQKNHNEGTEVHVSAKSRRKLKRKAERTIFPKDYSKRLRTTSLLNTERPSALLDKIRELFPVFREKHKKNSISATHPSSVPSSTTISYERELPQSSPPCRVQSDQQCIEFSEGCVGLNSPLRHLCLSREVDSDPIHTARASEVHSEGMWDHAFNFSSSSAASVPPPVLADDHFCRLVDNHLGQIRKNLNLPNLAKNAANILRRIITEQRQNATETNEGNNRGSQRNDTPSHVSPSYGDHVQIQNPLKKPLTTAEVIDLHRRNHQELNYLNVNLITSGPCHFWGENEVDLPGTGKPEANVSDIVQKMQNGPLGNKIPELDTPRIISNVYRFDKEDLKRMIIIGQVDNKFIAAKSCVKGNQAIVLFDQHAVHERIRLEKLLKDCREKSCTDDIYPPIKCTTISPPLQMELTDTEVRVVKSYLRHFENNGIKIEVTGRGALVFIHTVPICFIEGSGTGERRKADGRIINLLQNSIQHQVRYILETNGLTKQIPRETFELLCSRACRGAIKFGDKLDNEVCQELISQLAQCNSPFQCAHGRPVLTPILDLNSVPETQVYRADVSCFATDSSI